MRSRQYFNSFKVPICEPKSSCEMLWFTTCKQFVSNLYQILNLYHIVMEQVTLKNKHGELQVPVEVALSDVSEIKFETVTVPGSTVKKTSTMTMQQETGIYTFHSVV